MERAFFNSLEKKIKPKIRGENEREIHKNFVKDFPREVFEGYMYNSFETRRYTKDDTKSVDLRKLANEVYFNRGDLNGCLDLYSASLRYATYKNEDYAKVLANRSLILFKLSEYEKCLEDIDLCLEAQYPNNLKPKVFLRKCECFINMGKPEETITSANELVKLLENFERSTAEYYKIELKKVVSGINTHTFNRTRYDSMELPSVVENETFPGAAANVTLKKDQNGNLYVSSSTSIKKGEVLFMEKAYAFSLFKSEKSIYCQYCLKRLRNGVPCESCVKHMYCNETCQTLAWKEFHQWECCAQQGDFVDDVPEMMLALRIILKACQKETIPPPKKNIPVGQYSLIYHLQPILHNKETLQLDVENAMLIVNYLKRKTTFFEHLKSQRSFRNKSDIDLMTTIGALLIRHTSQMQRKTLIFDNYDTLTLDKLAVTACSSVSQMTHSCDPNTIYYYHNDVVVVKALTDIDVNTRLTYSYRRISYYHWPLIKRKELLCDLCNLKCECLHCSKPLMHLEKLDSYICIRCKGPAYLENSTYKCLDCGNIFKMPQNIKTNMELYEWLLKRYYTSQDIDWAREALAISKNFVQPYNFVYGKLYETMAINYIENGEPIKALSMIQLWLQLHEKRFDLCTVANTINQMRYSSIVLRCVEVHIGILPSNIFKSSLNKVKSALEKATEFSSVFCPILLTGIKCLKLNVSSLELCRNIDDTVGVGRNQTQLNM